MNLGGAVEWLLRGVGASDLTSSFIILLFFVFFLSLTMLVVNKWTALTSYTPGLLTSIGILGTFAGIVTGLLDFNPTELDKSVPTLLEGLKTAFISSLVGMTLSVVFKFISTLPVFQNSTGIRSQAQAYLMLFRAIEKQTEIVKITAQENRIQSKYLKEMLEKRTAEEPENIASYLDKLLDSTAKYHGESIDILTRQEQEARKLASYISDDGESSLTGQIKLMRTDFKDSLGQVSKNTDVIKTHMEGLEKQSLETGKQLKAQFEIENAHWTNEFKPCLDKLTGDSQASYIQLKTLGMKIPASLDSLEKQLNNAQQESVKHFAGLIEETAKTNQHFDKFDNAFTQFGDEVGRKLDESNRLLATSPTEKVIEALKEVTKEFNNIIVDQFGDNFKQLNLAVGSLLDWQENYRVQLAEMGRQYNEGVKAIQQSEVAVSSISKSAESIPENMESLGQILVKNKAQLDELGNHLEAFADLKDKAVSALPEISSIVDKMISELKEGNNTLIKSIDEVSRGFAVTMSESAMQLKNTTSTTGENLSRMSSSLEDTGKLLQQSTQQTRQELSNFGKEIVQQSEQATKRLKEDFEKSAGYLQQEIQKSAESHAEKARNIHANLQKTIEQSLVDTGGMIKTSVEDQFKAISDAREEEVHRVMTQMGEALVQITETFTSEYRELVDAMWKIVNYQAR